MLGHRDNALWARATLDPNRMRNQTRVAVLLLSLVALYAACGDDPSTTTGDTTELDAAGDGTTPDGGVLPDGGQEPDGSEDTAPDDAGADAPDIDPTLDRDDDGLPDLDEVTIWGTSPTVADTDGDGFSDKQEVIDLAFDRDVNNYQFNPRVADRPILDIELALAPLIYATFETTTGSTESIGRERSSETRSADSRTWGGSNSYAVEQSHTVGVSAGFDGWKMQASVSYSYSYSTTTENSTNWSREQTEENARTLTDIESFEESNEIASSGGVLAVSVRVTNRGDIAYFLDNLTLTAYELDPLDPESIRPVGVLQFLTDGDEFPRTRLDPGETSAPLSFQTDLDLPTVRALLADSRNLMIAPATWVVEGDGTVDFELASTAINARTAEVIIDYGFERELETYRVSTVSREGETSITVDEALTEILRIPYEQGTVAYRRDDLSDPEPSELGLISVRGLAMDDATTTLWTVVHSYPINNGADVQVDQYHPLDEAVDFGALVLQKGHTLQLTRIVDVDRDGLGERAEYAYGTDPNNDDTDGDGCEDGFEVAGWLVGEGDDAVRYRSSPVLPNTDFDLLNDCEEFAAGTNPADSDNTAPTVAIDAVAVDGVEVTYTVSFADAETGVVELRYVVDAEDEAIVAVAPEDTPVDIVVTYGEAGDHTFTVVASDDALLSEPATRTISVRSPTDGIAAHWPIAGDRDGFFSGILNDIARSNDANAVNIAFVTGRDGGGRGAAATNFSGDSGLITTDAFDLGASYTVAAWVVFDSVFSDTTVFGQVDRFVVEATPDSLAMYDMNGETFTQEDRLVAEIDLGSGWSRSGRFNLLVATVDGGTAAFYVDGDLVGTGPIAAVLPAETCAIAFGSRQTGSFAATTCVALRRSRMG